MFPVHLKDDNLVNRCGFDNSRSVGVLGLESRLLDGSVVDTVKSLQAAGACVDGLFKSA